MTLSQHVANFITTTTFSQLPTQLIARAKLHLLDTLGVALAGSTQSSSKQGRHGITLLPDSQGKIPIWGSMQTANTTAAP